jgi:hypothetical protein
VNCCAWLDNINDSFGERGMNLKDAKVRHVATSGGKLTVGLDDGRVISLPLDWYPSLKLATPAERAEWRPSAAGHGIHWPALDYDLSVAGLLQGAREAKGVLAFSRQARRKRRQQRARLARRRAKPAMAIGGA